MFKTPFLESPCSVTSVYSVLNKRCSLYRLFLHISHSTCLQPRRKLSSSLLSLLLRGGGHQRVGSVSCNVHTGVFSPDKGLFLTVHHCVSHIPVLYISLTIFQLFSDYLLVKNITIGSKYVCHLSF